MFQRNNQPWNVFFSVSGCFISCFKSFSLLLCFGSSGLMETSVVSDLSERVREQSSTLHFAKALARSRKHSSFPRNTGQNCSQKHWWGHAVGAASDSVQRLFILPGPTWAQCPSGLIQSQGDSCRLHLLASVQSLIVIRSHSPLL